MPAVFRPTLLALSTTCALAAFSVATASEDAPALDLQQQRQQMPAEFRQHLFGAPLSVRVELDGTYLGDAEVVLSEDNRVQLLAFGESHDSPLAAGKREHLASQLAEPVPLGRCHDQCAGLAAVHYSVENSLLSVLTDNPGAVDGRYLAQPEAGSTGLILRNNLTYSGGQQQLSAFRYGAELQGSVGQWTTAGNYQYYHASSSSDVDGHYISALYAQREFRDNFLRVGYFLPTFQGITRQPRAPGAQNYTSIGVMAGSSDALLSDYSSEAVYPVYVTASRQGVVEIYRDGNLISTQAVVPGMQAIDTHRLPGGIYDIELRVIEDGVIASSESAAIHKPSSWRDPSRRWRYSGFTGQQQGLLDSGNDPQQGKLTAGAVVNYLLHPRVVAGATVQQVGERRSTGVSLDWQANDRFNLYTNLYDSTDAGRGLDAQGMFRYRSGSVVLSHARSWVEQRERIIAGPGRPPRWKTYGGWQDSSSLSLNHRMGERDNLSFRVARNSGFNAGTSMDASWWRHQRLFGNDANWRVSVYDRPGGAFTDFRRQRGIDFTLSLALGNDSRRYNGSLGSRTGQRGQRDMYASTDVQQQLTNPWLQSVRGNASVDSSGLGLGAGAYFDQQQLQGDVQLLRSSMGGLLSGSANLQSTLVLGDGKAALLGRSQTAHADTGMIVDVRSDYPNLELRADDSRAGGVTLKPGRNFVPISAYRPGHVQFDFNGANAPAAAIQPASVSYHLNKGGVMHASVDVLRTFTVMGQVLDADGNGQRGVHMINHAGRSVSQDEGFFTLELSAREPVVELRYPNKRGCKLMLDESRYPREGDMLIVGGLRCPMSTAQF
jgi:hypothetical protein